MKTDEVPQDDGQLARKNIKELCYAVDENGNYTTAQSSGWEPKTITLQQQMESLNQRTQEALEGVRQGRLSPIAYYMELHRMDIPTLADYVGMWQWRVRRHLKAHIFRKLKPKIIRKYAEIFEIEYDELSNFQTKK